MLAYFLTKAPLAWGAFLSVLRLFFLSGGFANDASRYRRRYRVGAGRIQRWA
jgi:hypothetical protein